MDDSGRGAPNVGTKVRLNALGDETTNPKVKPTTNAAPDYDERDVQGTTKTRT